jgi:branched-chain amino acid transport system permease protein
MLIADLVVNGLITGLLYALMAIGLSLIFGVLRIVNFAHGEFYMVGAYTYSLITLVSGISPWLALPLAFLAGGVVGLLSERLLMRPLYAGYTSWGAMRDEYSVIVTFGLSLLLVSLADRLIGPFSYRGPSLMPASRLEFGPILLNGNRVLAAALGAAILAFVVGFIRYSYWGKQIQAVAQNRFGASLAGVNVNVASSLVFAISGGLAALSGALLAPFIAATPDVGLFPAVKSYVIVVLGGLGSIPGSIVASLLLGAVESIAAVYISYDYRDTFGLVVLILVLLLRPQGLFGQQGREV